MYRVYNICNIWKFLSQMNCFVCKFKLTNVDIENIEIIVETLPVSRETRGKRKCEAEQTKTPPHNKN